MNKIERSELIINPDGSIFHLHLLPEHLADTIILVGDPSRVYTISDLFDKIEFKIQNREFITHTGYFNGKRISVLGTGIGTDNIDIVINELDALVNIDLKNRTIKKDKKKLNFIRIGTSGAMQKDIEIDTFLLSEIAIGFDGLLNFYANRNKISLLKMEESFKKHSNWNENLSSPYFVSASENLVKKLERNTLKGVTISAPGFYAPQGRVLRLALAFPDLNKQIQSFNFEGQRITNFEMESSAIYGFSKLLGHEAVTICAIIANRFKKTYSSDYKKTIKKLIVKTLEDLTN